MKSYGPTLGPGQLLPAAATSTNPQKEHTASCLLGAGGRRRGKAGVASRGAGAHSHVHRQHTAPGCRHGESPARLDAGPWPGRWAGRQSRKPAHTCSLWEKH